ncbi:MAG: (2Fe-2S)-binding protein [Planctomycetota bacterium]|nr:(2Fe-2S)-binding protein [Planctomycetota bacterium]
MGPDDHVCYCFRVSLRKLVNYARRERPAVASQMSRCLDAGTGCGWCIPFLTRIWRDPDAVDLDVTPDEYAARRAAYRAGLSTGGARNEYE